jgi:hypothetical protein
MHGDGATVIIFLASLVGAVIALSVNICLARNKIGRWEPNSTVHFVMSIGAFGARQRQSWLNAGYSEKEADAIIDYQLFSLLEMPLGFVASAILLFVLSV